MKTETVEEIYPVRAGDLATPCMKPGIRELVNPQDVPPDTMLYLFIDRPVDSPPPKNLGEALGMCAAPFW